MAKGESGFNKSNKSQNNGYAPGDSPYQSFSTFAGNPYFIDLDTLVEEGVLDKKDCEKVNWGKKPEEVDYEKIYKGRYPLL